MTEQDVAEQLGAILRQLSHLDESTGELTDAVADQYAETARIGQSLTALRARLPEGDEPLPQLFVRRQRFRSVVAAMLVAGLLVASVVGVVVGLNHQLTCATRSVLVLARNNVERSPVPTDPDLLARRSQSLAFYATSLGKLKILWPCAGEDHVPVAARP